MTSSESLIAGYALRPNTQSIRVVSGSYYSEEKKRSYKDKYLLVLGDPLTRGTSFDPIQTPELFVRFSELVPRRQGGSRNGGRDMAEVAEVVAAFANQFGFLGKSYAAPIDDFDGLDHISVERVRDWLSEIDALSLVVEVWGLISKNVEDELARRFHWQPGFDFPMIVYRHDGLRLTVAAERGMNSAEYKGIEKSDVVAAAHLLIQDLINDRLRKYTRAVLISKPPKFDRSYVKVRADSLLGAIWAQASEAYCSSRPLELCAASNCGRAFFPRRSRKGGAAYCSDRCKQAGYRERKTGESNV